MDATYQSAEYAQLYSNHAFLGSCFITAHYSFGNFYTEATSISQQNVLHLGGYHSVFTGIMTPLSHSLRTDLTDNFP